MPKKKIEFQVTPRAVDDYRIVLEPDNPVTKCTIYSRLTISISWGLKAYGIGVRKHGDVYDLETGCRMALRSALRMIRQEEIRKAIWAKYLELFPISERKEPQVDIETLMRDFEQATLCLSMAAIQSDYDRIKQDWSI